MKLRILRVFFILALLFSIFAKPVSADLVVIPDRSYRIELLLVFLITTLLFELPVFFVLGLRTKKAILTALLANIVSVPAFYLVVLFSSLDSIPILVLAEIAVAVFEGAIIAVVLEQIGLRKAITFALVANAVSAVGGYLALTYILMFTG